MYFDIALHYHTTIKAKQHEQKTLKKVIITASHRLPSHTGPGMLTTKVATMGSGQPWVLHGDKPLNLGRVTG